MSRRSSSTGDSDQNGVTWTSTCDWEGEWVLEIDLDISGGSDFPDGKVAIRLLASLAGYSTTTTPQYSR